MILSPLYIDPGTGSMLFSIIIGLATTAVFGFRALLIKLKSVLGRGKQERLDKSHRGIVIYTDSKRYWNVFCPICHEFERREIPLTYYTQSADDPALAEDFKYVHAEFIGEGNKGFAKMNFLNADICLATTPNLDVYQWKRSKNCKFYVHVPHSMGDFTGYRMFALDFYDAVFCTGDYQIKDSLLLEQIRQTRKKQYVTVGYPPLDEMAKKLSSIPDDKVSGTTTVLVAPSWGKNSLLEKFEGAFLSSLRETGYTIIIRPHPQTVMANRPLIDRLMLEFPETATFHWNFDNDNFSVMCKSDILISDFSAIMYEYAFLFNRPVIYTDIDFDNGVYDAAWIEDDMWKIKSAPKIGVKLNESDFPEMHSVISQTLSNKALSASLQDVKKQGWMHEGESVGRIVDYLVSKESEIRETDMHYVDS